MKNGYYIVNRNIVKETPIFGFLQGKYIVITLLCIIARCWLFRKKTLSI